MKKFILPLVAFIVLASAFSTLESKKGLGKVQRFEGKDVFILSEPAEEYDVVATYNYKIVSMSNHKISDYVKFSLRKAAKVCDEKPYDGIIINDDGKDIAIKYKKESED